jgi:hypothetical protein
MTEVPPLEACGAAAASGPGSSKVVKAMIPTAALRNDANFQALVFMILSASGFRAGPFLGRTGAPHDGFFSVGTQP